MCRRSNHAAPRQLDGALVLCNRRGAGGEKRRGRVSSTRGPKALARDKEGLTRHSVPNHARHVCYARRERPLPRRSPRVGRPQKHRATEPQRCSPRRVRLAPRRLLRASAPLSIQGSNPGAPARIGAVLARRLALAKGRSRKKSVPAPQPPHARRAALSAHRAHRSWGVMASRGDAGPAMGRGVRRMTAGARRPPAGRPGKPHPLQGVTYAEESTPLRT